MERRPLTPFSPSLDQYQNRFCLRVTRKRGATQSYPHVTTAEPPPPPPSSRPVAACAAPAATCSACSPRFVISVISPSRTSFTFLPLPRDLLVPPQNAIRPHTLRSRQANPHAPTQQCPPPLSSTSPAVCSASTKNPPPSCPSSASAKLQTCACWTPSCTRGRAALSSATPSTKTTWRCAVKANQSAAAVAALDSRAVFAGDGQRCAAALQEPVCARPPLPDGGRGCRRARLHAGHALLPRAERAAQGHRPL